MVFSTNHLGPFLLTNLLRDLLVRSAPARVITVSSAWHKQVRSIPWERLERDHACTYEESKLLNVVFSQELARHLNGTGVTANCLSPGFVRTRLGRDATGAFRLLLRVTRPIQTTADKGAQTSVHLASAPEVATVTGGYFENRRQAEPSVLARDQTAAERLWRLSAKLTGLDPD
jgi:NAD(P)-dependent dehydrogenase (short-subunit alcohol dehydrogenase family)